MPLKYRLCIVLLGVCNGHAQQYLQAAPALVLPERKQPFVQEHGLSLEKN